MWKLSPTTEYEEEQVECATRCPASLVYCLAKLKIVLTALSHGGRVPQLRYNFLRPEGKGVFRIGCSGKGKPVLRMYLYFDETTNTIHQITLGGKSNQQADIRHCHQFVERLRLAAQVTNNDKTKVLNR
jgi:hypothetical protein